MVWSATRPRADAGMQGVEERDADWKDSSRSTESVRLCSWHLVVCWRHTSIWLVMDQAGFILFPSVF